MNPIKTILMWVFSILILVPTAFSSQHGSSTMEKQVGLIGKAPGQCLAIQSENKCRVKSHERLTLQLPEEQFIDNIVLSADDKFGEASNARVNVLLDGRQIAKDVDIMERGAELVFSPGTRGRIIEIVPANDGEVNIHWLRVYGY